MAGITNGDFETGDLTGWTASFPDPAIVTEVRAAAAHGGSYGAYLSADGAMADTCAAISQIVTLAGNPTLTVWVRCVQVTVSGDVEGAWIWVEDADGSVVEDYIQVAGDYQEVTLDISALVAGAATVMLAANAMAGGGETIVYYDDAVLGSATALAGGRSLRRSGGASVAGGMECGQGRKRR